MNSYIYVVVTIAIGIFLSGLVFTYVYLYNLEPNDEHK